MKHNIELFYREGSSDKVYKASLTEEPKGFVVNFAYGRRGNTLTTGTKTVKPVPYEQALKIYNKLVQEKTAKGYIEDPHGKPFTGTVTETKDTGVRPQLLNEIDESEVDSYINNDEWCAQEKFDGRRRMLVITGHIAEGTNRKGLIVPIDRTIEVDACFGLNPTTETHYVLDGEAIDDYIVIFDYPKIGMPYSRRYQKLVDLFKGKDPATLKLISTAWTTAEKKALYKKLKKDNAEGIVFKNINAGFVPGRPSSGGDQLKFKFCATATAQVVKTNPTKRSVLVAVYDPQGNKIEVGNVTVYPNQQIPQAGSIVEVKYLYYFPDGSLFQPVLLGERDDMTVEDCTLSQLKEKREEVTS
jgi:bifunctional non-homologous end joining protein LigD